MSFKGPGVTRRQSLPDKNEASVVWLQKQSDKPMSLHRYITLYINMLMDTYNQYSLGNIKC